jgi:RHS repeat-associated protein
MNTLQGNRFTWYPFNQIQRRTATGLNFTYGYTADSERLLSWNRAISPDRFSITIRDLDGKVIREFAFDGGTTTYAWVKDYIHASGKLLATVDDEHGTRHYHLDHLGTPRVITDASGQLITDDEGEPIGLNAYSPFGIQLIGEGEERLKFTGHERDTGSIDYMHARYHSPMVGRFLSVDPAGGRVGGSKGCNRYSYVENNPIRAIDPNGETLWDIADFGFAAASIGNLWVKAIKGENITMSDNLQAIGDAMGMLPVVPALGTGGRLAKEGAELGVDALRGADKAGDGTRKLLHGTDAGAADDIVAHGINRNAAAELGGGDVFWMTESRETARLFAQVNPAGGNPAIIGVDLPTDVVLSS